MTSRDVAVDPLVGRLLDGRYRLESVIARGGMATVYLGTDARLDRVVAVKVMRPALAEDPDFVDRFSREARAAARLSCPEVVAVHDQGRDSATGTAYLVMEHVRGRTLRDVLREHGPLPARQALELLEPVLRALAAAHAAGLVHRDVKPENVLLADDGRVKVADFGLARAVETSSLTTSTGLLLGTMAYLSPEQVLHGIADPRSDVYAAGILLWELLTGAPPYTGDSPMAVAYRHVNDDVPSPGTVVEGVPPAVEELVRRATRRDPGARPVDAGAFLAEVRTLLVDLPDEFDTVVVRREPMHPTLVVPRPAQGGRPPRPAPTSPPRRRRRTGWLWALLVALLAAAALGGGWYLGSGRYTDAPSVRGMDATAAQAALARSDLRVRVLPQGRFDEQVASGLVLEQQPGATSRLRRGSLVTLVLSQGPDRRAVPDVAGKDRAEATAALVAVGLRAGPVAEEFADAPAGTVLRTDPAAGQGLRPDSPVALVLSKGVELLPVPSVVGKAQADAGKTLQDAGFRSKAVEAFDNTVAKGTVMAQDPTGGQAPRGATITLRISKGPDLVAVPDVVNRPRDAAVAAVEAAGLKASVFAIPGPGTVRSSDPPAGTQVKRGSTVKLFVF